MKLPKHYAEELALLHNKVMEVQELFQSLLDDINCGLDEDDYKDVLEEGIDLENEDFIDELQEIVYKLDDLEADTSELDCKYNDYGN